MSNFLPVVKLEFINDKQVPAVTSQQLAEAFGKQHTHVMRDIRETTAKCSKLFSASNFGLAEYLDEQGKSRPMYLMTKDGFTMVAMAYTTPEAVRFKEAYIAEFNRMEETLRQTASQQLFDITGMTVAIFNAASSPAIPRHVAGFCLCTCHPLRVSICCREIKERVHGQMDD